MKMPEMFPWQLTNIKKSTKVLKLLKQKSKYSTALISMQRQKHKLNELDCVYISMITKPHKMIKVNAKTEQQIVSGVC